MNSGTSAAKVPAIAAKARPTAPPIPNVVRDLSAPPPPPPKMVETLVLDPSAKVPALALASAAQSLDVQCWHRVNKDATIIVSH